MLAHDEFVADVAAVWKKGGQGESFGSGRLIAPNLILTAGHVVDCPTREAPARTGWKIALVRERDRDTGWEKRAHRAKLIWRGKGDLDLALLEITGKKRLEPKIKPYFALYVAVEALGEVIATGFPNAWVSEKDLVLDYTVPGCLRIASELGYAWTVLSANKPDDPKGWKGMSGSSVCRLGSDNKLHLFGVVEHVPANFSEGMLSVSRLSEAFGDAEFKSHLERTLGSSPLLDRYDFPHDSAADATNRIFRARIRAFGDEYLTSESGPVPFGGRNDELSRLGRWLLDPQYPPRMLVTSPAGRGKSALLVQWIKSLQDGGVCNIGGWQLVFMPISIRAGTNVPDVFYEGLARQLSEITGQALPTDAFRDSDGFRYAVRDQLDRLGSDKRPRVLIVIDGLDEALDGSFDPGVLPSPMPPNIRILLSARWQQGDHDSTGWLERLGWDRNVKVEAFELEELAADQIADVLVRLGAPGDILANEPGLVERLSLLTAGEPVLVKLYAEDLWKQTNTGARITRADLDDLKPGFDSYFKRWFAYQEQLWKDEGNINTREADAVLSVMAFALGPLGESDLLALLKQIHGLEGAPAVDRMLQPLRRWIFGNGKGEFGYVLSHPKISEYLQTTRFTAIASKLDKGFADWGTSHCVALNEGLSTKEASRYCLQFLPAHLKKVEASPDTFMKMVENGWRLAWEAFEAGHRGFESAVRSAFTAQKQDSANLRLGARWRCALTLSSIKSLGDNVSPELLLAAVNKGVLSIAHAAEFADLKGPCFDTVQLLSGLALISGDNTVQSRLLDSAVSASRAIGNKPFHAKNLAEFAFRFPPEKQAELLDEALAAAKSGGEIFQRTEALSILAYELGPRKREEALKEAFFAAKAETNAYYRAASLAALASRLPREQRDEAARIAREFAKSTADAEKRASISIALVPSTPGKRDKVLDEALDAAISIKNEWARAMAFRDLVQNNLGPKQLSRALAAAKAIGDNHSRVIALTSLALRLEPDHCRDTLNDAFTAAKTCSSDSGRAAALRMMAPHLTPEQANEAIAAARTIQNVQTRALAFGGLARHMEQEQVKEALATSKFIDDYYFRAEALGTLVSHLSTASGSDALSLAFAAAEVIDFKLQRTKALAALFKHLPPTQRSERAASEMLAVADDWHKTEAIVVLAPHLPPEQREAAIAGELAAVVADNDVANLALLIPLLSPLQRNEALAQMLPPARRINAHAVAALARHLQPEEIEEALKDLKIEDENSLASVMTAKARYVPEERVGKWLAFAKGISDGAYRSNVLVALAPRLTPELAIEALAAAATHSDEMSRARMVIAITPNLAPEQRHEALPVAAAFKEAYHRAHVFGELARLLPQRQHEAIGHAIDAVGLIQRSLAFSIVQSLTPLTGELGDQVAIDELYRAIKDVCSWYP